MTKDIILIRHGESESNVGSFWPTDYTPLTCVGIQQSMTLALCLSTSRIGAILSSPITRAMETSKLISNCIGVTVEPSELLRERRQPSELIGQSKDSPYSMAIYSKIQYNFWNAEFRFSDEETFPEIASRTTSLLEMLRNRSEKRIVLVTHSFFMRMLLARVIFGETMEAEMFARVVETCQCNNAGISIFQLIGNDASPSEWRVCTWNDISHLPTQHA